MPTMLPPEGTVILTIDEELNALSMSLDTSEIVIPRPDPASIILALEESKGETGNTGPVGPVGPVGPQGGPGPPLHIKGSVPDASHLPTTGNQVSDMWVTANDGHGHAWDGTQWVDTGNFQGPQGVQGPAATVAVGSTITAPPGSQANVTNSGSSSAAVFNFTIPQGQTGNTGSVGPPGPAATIVAGTTSTGSPGTPATVTNVGSTSAAVFNFVIPQGVQGVQGNQGIQGIQGAQGVPGPPLTVKGTVPTSTSLPSSGNSYGDLWIALDTGHGWCWNPPGTWVDTGPFQGPPGPTVVSANTGNVAKLGTDNLLLVSGPPSGNAVGPQVVLGTDTRLSDARTPLAHAPSHLTGGDPIPNAGPTTRGLLTALSGAASDYVGGDNACHPLSNLLPTGTVLDFCGASAPAGFLFCQGQAVPRTTYAALYAALGGASSPWGQGDGSTTFNIPDLRGRVSVGAGQGTYSGATNQVLAATGGEEKHVLTAAELVSHTHGVAHTHTMGNHTHFGVNHLHDLQNHQHYCGGVDHLHGMDHYHNINASGWHAHGLGGHYHGYTTCALGAGGYQLQPAAGGAQVNNPGANTGGPSGGSDGANFAATNTVYASQTNGAWANSGASDRSLAFWSNAPNINNTGACDRDLTTSGPSTNTTDGASIANTAAAGGGSGFNVMQPFAVINKIIRT
jgi:microcystin-dependent protein